MIGGGRLRRLAGLAPSWTRLAWWGLVSPALEAGPARVHQALVLDGSRLLLAVRADLCGWELPGGAARPGESGAEAACREVAEETGLAVEALRVVGVYRRTGFRPHTATVHLCRPLAGSLRPSRETPRVAWFPVDALPDTLFPWYRTPVADALAARPEPVSRCERLGLAAVWAGMRIDLRMRLGGP